MSETTTWDVYVAFRKAQANFHSRPYRLPKDWDKHFSKMSKSNREALELAAERFNTRWSNIDIDRYFETGFDLIKKNFTYTKFFDPKIMSLYIQRDKIEKRNLDLKKTDLVKSAGFVMKYMGERNCLKKYARSRVGLESIPVKHYIKGDIDQFFLTWLIKEKYILLEDQDRTQIPYIVEKYREYVSELDKIKPFLDKLKEKI